MLGFAMDLQWIANAAMFVPGLQNAGIQSKAV